MAEQTGMSPRNVKTWQEKQFEEKVRSHTIKCFVILIGLTAAFGVWSIVPESIYTIDMGQIECDFENIQARMDELNKDMIWLDSLKESLCEDLNQINIKELEYEIH